VETVQPEKVILYGSYATGQWQEDRYSEKQVVYSFDSDYDILVITKSGERRKDYEISSQITNLARYRVPLNVITHDIDYINEKLSVGQYFFTEIINQGVVLYDSGNTTFSEPKQLSNKEQQAIAKQEFDKWYGSATEFLEGAKFSYQRNNLKVSVFILHQAAERYFDTMLLVFTGYKPKTHNLDKLRTLTKKYSIELFALFSSDNREDERLFSLLVKGYIDARYNDSYFIQKSELNTLIERVEKMREIVADACERRIKSIV
jgi:HEPN domain-containing protein/predicted nucleotidyltransferase